MIHSVLQIITFQILFLTVYDIFLKKETFFNLNRIYLLLTPVLGILLPFISFSFIQQNIPQEYVLQLPAVLIVDNNSQAISNEISFVTRSFLALWVLGMVISAIFFIGKLYKIAKLKAEGISENYQSYKLVRLPNTGTAFSFFNSIYLGENFSEENKINIIAHEKVHVQQKHSLDLLFFEFLRIVLWFNPPIYLFQNRISTLHEFIADAAVTAQKDKKQYYQKLLSEIFQTEKISFINTFFNQSLIKKRIIMLQKPKSKKTAQLKYLLFLPAISAMLIYSSCSDEVKNSELEKSNKKIAPVVIIDTIQTDERITDVPFSVIEQVPVYPGCAEADNEAMKKCMSMNISQFINSNFNIELGNALGLVGRQKIAVQFKINKTGKIVDVRARAPHPELEAEAIRVVKLLPQMEPGQQKGENVGVLYSLPIVFDVVE